MINDLEQLIPDGRRRYIESLTKAADKRVETLIDDFLELDPDHRLKYIDTLTDLLCNRNHLYPNRLMVHPADTYTFDDRAPEPIIQ